MKADFSHKSSKTEEGDDIHFLVQCLGQGCFFPFLMHKKQNESCWREFQFQQNIKDASLLKREETFSLFNAVTIYESS
jgi:hypothetical protein